MQTRPEFLTDNADITAIEREREKEVRSAEVALTYYPVYREYFPLGNFFSGKLL